MMGENLAVLLTVFNLAMLNISNFIRNIEKKKCEVRRVFILWRRVSSSPRKGSKKV